MVLRSVPVHDEAQVRDILSRAKTLFMDWKGRKQRIRRRRAQGAARFGFFGLRVVLGFVGLGDFGDGGGADIPLLEGGDADAPWLEEDIGNGEAVENGVCDPIDQQPQDGAQIVNDPLILRMCVPLS